MKRYCIVLLFSFFSFSYGMDFAPGERPPRMYPFHWAIARGDMELLKHYASTEKTNINQCDLDGRTPLMKAVLNEQIEMVRILLNEGGADPNASSSPDDPSAEELAQKINNKDILDLIEKAKMSK